MPEKWEQQQIQKFEDTVRDQAFQEVELAKLKGMVEYQNNIFIVSLFLCLALAALLWMQSSYDGVPHPFTETGIFISSAIVSYLAFQEKNRIEAVKIPKEELILKELEAEVLTLKATLAELMSDSAQPTMTVTPHIIGGED